MGSSQLKSCLSVFGLVLACLCVIVGIIGIVMGPDILQNQINNQLPLSPYSDQIPSWEVPPVPIYLQFWLWEVVNPVDVLVGIKPMIVQRGPFTYAEYRHKVGVAFNDNDTVTYRQKVSYVFLRDLSYDDETRPITMVNAPLVTIVSLASKLQNRTQEIIDFITKIYNESLFATHTASEWVWGYEDELLKAAMKIPIIKDIVKDDHFGYFYGQNATDDGLYTVFTGQSNLDLLNSVDKWNGVSYLSYWGDNYSNQINGTDGSWFSPLYKKDFSNTRLYLYSTDVCRSLYAKFEQHSTVLDIPTEIFSIPQELFINSSVNPDNEPFGLNVSGVFNVSICRQGAPIFISFPHLLYADEKIRNGVDGLSPDAAVHRTLFEVEPHTGLVLSAQKRLQINLFVKHDEYFQDFKHIKDVILPAIWINESTTIDQKSADDLNSQILRFFIIIRWVSIGLIPFAVVLFLIIIILVAKRRSRRGSSTPLLFAQSHNSIAHPGDY